MIACQRGIIAMYSSSELTPHSGNFRRLAKADARSCAATKLAKTVAATRVAFIVYAVPEIARGKVYREDAQVSIDFDTASE